MSRDTLTNRTRCGGFIESEALFARSRDTVVFQAGSGGGLVLAGTLMGMISALGKYVPSPVSASDGSGIAVGISFDDVDTSQGDVVASIVAREAEVRADGLFYDPSVNTIDLKRQKWAQLEAIDGGIIVRWRYPEDVS